MLKNKTVIEENLDRDTTTSGKHHKQTSQAHITRQIGSIVKWLPKELNPNMVV